MRTNKLTPRRRRRPRGGRRLLVPPPRARSARRRPRWPRRSTQKQAEVAQAEATLAGYREAADRLQGHVRDRGPPRQGRPGRRRRPLARRPARVGRHGQQGRLPLDRRRGGGRALAATDADRRRGHGAGPPGATPSAAPASPPCRSSCSSRAATCDLSELFTRLERFVTRATSDRIDVTGRLLRVEGADARARTAATTASSTRPSTPARTSCRATEPLSLAPPRRPARPTHHPARRRRHDAARHHRDHHGSPPMSIVTDIWRQLVRRRLWPVALLLVAALAAVPLLLAKDPEPAARGGRAGREAPTASGVLAAEPIVSVATDEAGGKRRRSRSASATTSSSRPPRRRRPAKAGHGGRRPTTPAPAGRPAAAGPPRLRRGPRPTPAPAPTRRPRPKPKTYPPTRSRCASATRPRSSRWARSSRSAPCRRRPAAARLPRAARGDGKTAVFLLDRRPAGDRRRRVPADAGELRDGSSSRPARPSSSTSSTPRAASARSTSSTCVTIHNPSEGVPTRRSRAGRSARPRGVTARPARSRARPRSRRDRCGSIGRTALSRPDRCARPRRGSSIGFRACRCASSPPGRATGPGLTASSRGCPPGSSSTARRSTATWRAASSATGAAGA